MYYILNENVGLRSYKRVPFCIVIKGVRNPIAVSISDYFLMSKCDGLNDIEDNDDVKHLEYKGLIKRCNEGEFKLSPWQNLDCDNYVFPAAIIEITSICNYNCKHCFNAVDNNPLHDSFSKEEMIDLLDQLSKAGVNAITLTGGEPMLHKDFFDIVFEIHKRGMFLEELNTNGYFISKGALAKLKIIRSNPLIKISFDGLGHHNWMRGNEEAQDKTINAIKLCVENGFRVKVQTNVWKGNLDTLLETAEYLDSIGVSEMRIIRTTDVPRWLENGYGETLNSKEYYDAMLEFVKGYKSKNHKMRIDIWQFLRFNPNSKSYKIMPIIHDEGTYRDSYPRCQGCRGMIAIGANGNVYPCLQESGVYDYEKVYLGNVKKDKLHDLLNDSNYFKDISTTVGELKQSNEKCGNCKYFRYCTGGCPALAFNEFRQMLREDSWKCYFFENKYYKKIDYIFKDCISESKMNID